MNVMSLSISEVVAATGVGGKSFVLSAVFVFVLASMRNDNQKNRYYYLILFIIALCAGFYLLLYLYNR